MNSTWNIFMLNELMSVLNSTANYLTCAVVFATACVATLKTWYDRKKNKIKTKKFESFNLLGCSILCGGIAISCIVTIAVKAGPIGAGLSMVVTYAVVVNAVYVVFGKLEQLDIKERLVDKPKKNKGRKKR